MNQDEPAEWHRRLKDLNLAQAEFDDAERILVQSQMTSRRRDGPGQPGKKALVRWPEFASRRALRASRRLSSATFALTGGRPLLEVIWSLPDDL